MATVSSEFVASMALHWNKKLNVFFNDVCNRQDLLAGDAVRIACYERRVGEIITDTISRTPRLCSLDFLMFKIYEKVWTLYAQRPRFKHADLEPPHASAFPIVDFRELQRRLQEGDNHRHTITQYVKDSASRYLLDMAPHPLGPPPAKTTKPLPTRESTQTPNSPTQGRQYSGWDIPPRQPRSRSQSPQADGVSVSDMRRGRSPLGRIVKQEKSVVIKGELAADPAPLVVVKKEAA